jgi:tRNA (guanine37-N1)-methyltransferase
LLDCPRYTRPGVFGGRSVPTVLMGGGHAEIAKWRRQQSLLVSWQKRPELIEQARGSGLLTKADEQFLKALNPK